MEEVTKAAEAAEAYTRDALRLCGVTAVGTHYELAGRVIAYPDADGTLVVRYTARNRADHQLAALLHAHYALAYARRTT